jgi:hypothetical protein
MRSSHNKQEEYASLFYQTRKSHFSADFQDKDSIMHECVLYNPNDGK